MYRITPSLYCSMPCRICGDAEYCRAPASIARRPRRVWYSRSVVLPSCPSGRNQHDIGLVTRRRHVGAARAPRDQSSAGLVGFGVKVLGQVSEYASSATRVPAVSTMTGCVRLSGSARRRHARCPRHPAPRWSGPDRRRRNPVCGCWPRHDCEAGVAQRLSDLVRRRAEHVGLVLLGCATRGDGPSRLPITMCAPSKNLRTSANA